MMFIHAFALLKYENKSADNNIIYCQQQIPV